MLFTDCSECFSEGLTGIVISCDRQLRHLSFDLNSMSYGSKKSVHV